MAEKIKEHWSIAFSVGMGLFLAIVGMLMISGTIGLPNPASAATETVIVTATVVESLSISVSPTTTALSPDLVDIGGGTSIGSSTDIEIVVSTNNGGGYNLTIEGANNGLATSTFLIASVSATGTIVAGTDGYGANATSVQATVDPDYDYWGTDDVGQIATSTALSSYGNPVTNSTTTMKIEAAASAAKEAGTYEDTITLTATGGA